METGIGERLAASARRPTTLLVGATVLVAIAYRLYALGRLPGLNGDEAWYGAQAQRLADGLDFAWRTPNGNVPGPLQGGLLFLLQMVIAPSLTLLRVPSVLASLGQMALAYAVGRRHFGRETGAVALVLTAVLPVNIAYARFGWDPSHTGVVAMAAAHFALAGTAWASAALFALALLVHPTNVFLAPFLALAFAGAEARRGGWGRATVRGGVHVALLAAVLPILAVTSAIGGAFSATGDPLQRLVDPAAWRDFTVLFTRLLDGDTIYAYITGNGLGSARLAADLGTGLLLVALVVVGAWRLRKDLLGPEAGVVVGWLAALLAFFVLVGPWALRPYVERYAMCLVVPTTLALAVLLRELTDRGARAWRAWVPTAAVAALALIGFGSRYLGALEETGSTSHETFWTGPVEPKQEAFQRILDEAAPHGGARVIAESFWLYWPLKYLAHGRPLDVEDSPEVGGEVPPGGTYWVGFAGGPMERWAEATPSVFPRWGVPAAGGHVAVRVWWTPPPLTRGASAGEPR